MIARPKPVQKPHPPIHVGGAFPHGARRAIRYGDGWIPTARGDLADVLPKFREMAREAGRDPASIEITSFGLGEDLDRLKRLAGDGRRARRADVPAREGGQGAADHRPVDENHAAGECVKGLGPVIIIAAGEVGGFATQPDTAAKARMLAITLSSPRGQTRRPGEVTSADGKSDQGKNTNSYPTVWRSIEQLPSLAAYALITATLSNSEAIDQ